MFKLLISIRAANAAKKLPYYVQDAVTLAMEEIVDDPFLGKPLSRELSDKLSFRVGVYRIVYTVSVKENTIRVLRIGHRSNVYN